MTANTEKCSNNTNKLSPQEPISPVNTLAIRSNNTNKLSPQEHSTYTQEQTNVQIIQINLVLKNLFLKVLGNRLVQIIQINLVLKNPILTIHRNERVQIIQINLVLKNLLRTSYTV